MAARGAGRRAHRQWSFTRADATQHRTVNVQDVVPLQSGDGRGLTGFYLVIGWIVGGYLLPPPCLASPRAPGPTTCRAVIRLLAMIPYAVLSGLGGALIVDQVLGALTGHFMEACGTLGALLVYAVTAVTMDIAGPGRDRRHRPGRAGVRHRREPIRFGRVPDRLAACTFWRAISYALPHRGGH